ncbi:hypothetical protein NVP1084O_172 [Vibrio phage 1.084.O._10N.261.49.F5]|nr:hypothetical protein NVP1084O_172 [Vibrio phage 1.084.O._10N.261.49.F5]
MAIIDFYTDATGVNDLVLNENGDFRFTETTEESLAQRVRNRLTTWQGEWSFDTLYGTPYRTQYMQSGKSKSELDTLTKSIIFEEEDVTAVYITSTIDRVNRKYIIERAEVYHNNEIIDIPISDPAEKTNTYPEPMSFADFQICSLGDVSLDAVNELHQYINHIGLPEYAAKTWWRQWSSHAIPPEEIGIFDIAINTDYPTN